MNQIALIIVAAGNSSRMGGEVKKEYLPLNNGTVLSSVALAFLSTKSSTKNKITQIITVIPHNDEQNAKKAFFADSQIEQLILQNNVKIDFVNGGKSRQESVFNALEFLENLPSNLKPDFVLIHDGARPFLSTNLISDAIENTVKYGAAVPAINVVDTQKEIDQNSFIRCHLVRNNLRAVQTPQGFNFNKILNCHKAARTACLQTKNVEYTDDSEIYDMFSTEKTFVFDGEIQNKKITYKEDFLQNKQKENSMIFTGIGYDKHRLVEGRRLMIGGIEIPFEKGEYGHSDGDAVLHAITDALLGASHLGDIGSYFPDTDSKYKDADSKELLKFAWHDVKNAGYNLSNLDVVVLLEKPKFLPFRQKVISSIANILNVSEDKVFIKAKTGEKLGDVGNNNCIEVFATCLLTK